VDVQIENAVIALRAGGVIAYPTEYCFGLGCEQGVILVAATIEQISEYADLNLVPNNEEVMASWPGPNTWVLPAKGSVSDLVRGKHTSIAMRISAHEVCRSLCKEFAHPIVSTSANRHGQRALLSAVEVREEFNHELDFVVDLPVGNSSSASTRLNLSSP